MQQNILLLTDGSSCSARAARKAIELASRLDTSIHAVTVLETYPDDVLEKLAMFQEIFDEAREMAEQSVEDVRKWGADKQVNVEKTVLEDEHPVEAILQLIKDRSYEFVVMGTHGRSGLERFFLGSTTERVLRASPIPVLAVPRGKQDED